MSDQQPPAPVPKDEHPPIHPVAPRLKDGPKIPHVGPHIHAYKKAHEETVGHESDKWWAKVSIPHRPVSPAALAHTACVNQMARETLHWDRPFHTVRAGGFETGDIVWFPEGGLNASYNCVDRWAFKHPDKVRTLTPS